MKLRYTVATLTLGIISSQATIVSPANVITGDAAELPLVIDNSGTLLADGGGSIAIGSFNSTNYVDFSAENFRQFGAGVQALSNNLGASGGFFNAIEFQEDSGTTGELEIKQRLKLQLFSLFGNQPHLFSLLTKRVTKGNHQLPS